MVLSEDTKKLRRRDVEIMKAKQAELAKKLGEALNEYPNWMIHGALKDVLVYGFRLPNGSWHPAPRAFDNTIILSESETKIWSPDDEVKNVAD